MWGLATQHREVATVATDRRRPWPPSGRAPASLVVIGADVLRAHAVTPSPVRVHPPMTSDSDPDSESNSDSSRRDSRSRYRSRFKFDIMIIMIMIMIMIIFIDRARARVRDL